MRHKVARWRIDSTVDHRPRAEYLRRLRALTPWQRVTPFAFLGLMALVVVIPKAGLPIMGLAIVRIVQLWSGYFKPTEGADPEVEALVDEPSPVPQYPVDIAVCRDGVLIGEDRGVLTFVDDWLNYDGLACSFSLSRVDVDRIQRSNELTIKQQREQRGLDGFWHRIVCQGQPSIVIGLNARNRATGRTGLQGEVNARLTDWGENRFLVTVGASVLPPRTPHPNAWFRPWLQRGNALLGATGTAAFAGCLYLQSKLDRWNASSEDVLLVMIGASFLIVGYLVLAALWRATCTEEALTALQGEAEIVPPTRAPLNNVVPTDGASAISELVVNPRSGTR